MKKIFALVLVTLLVLTGCGSKASGQDVKIGTGLSVSAKTTAPGEKAGNVQTDVYYATVVMKDDKFVQVQIDAAQNKQEFNAEGTISEFKFEGTKKILGPKYGMKQYGNAIAEWDEQVKSFEKWVVGKTLQEVLAMKTYEKDANHPAVPAEEDLKSSVTIDVSTLLQVIEKAANNAVEVKNVASVGNTAFTAASTEKFDITTTVGAAAFDADGKVVYSFIDAAQVTAKVEEGVAVVKTDLRTKGELKEEYNMKGASKLGKEWYEQINDFQAWANGKTAKEIDSATEADLNSTISIYPLPFKSAITVSSQKAIELPKK